MKKLIDIGANLTNSQFKFDIVEVLQRAKKSHITHIILTGTSLDSSCDALDIVQKYPDFLKSTAGIHPHDAKTWNDDAKEELIKMCSQSEVVAIGECGLDYNRNYSVPEIQRLCFEEQLLIAQDIQKPVFLHERDAHKDFFRILKKHRSSLSNAVVHCFTGNKDALIKYLDIGCHIGITGWVCDPRRGKELQDLVKLIPYERLMIETDSPFLIPRDTKVKLSGRRNEPAYLIHVLETIAKLRNISTETLAEKLYDTTRSFFNLNSM